MLENEENIFYNVFEFFRTGIHCEQAPVPLQLLQLPVERRSPWQLQGIHHGRSWDVQHKEGSGTLPLHREESPRHS